MICLYIKNISELLENNIGQQNLELRKIALDLLENSIQAVRPKILVEKSIKIQNKRLYINNDVLMSNSVFMIYLWISYVTFIAYILRIIRSLFIL